MLRQGLHEEMAALRVGYREALPAKIDALAAALAGCLAAPHDPARLGTVRQIAHTLRGTSGSYGFLAISAAVARIENLLEAVGGEPGRADALHEPLDRALIALRQALAAE